MTEPSSHKAVPLSCGQSALWHIQQLYPQTSAYSVSVCFRILSEVDIPALQRTFRWLLDRHASLRTTYHLENRELIQRIHPSWKVHFKVHEVSDRSEEEASAELTRESQRPFDLEKGPLMRVNLYLRRPGHHLLLVSFHHIAVDLWSVTVLFEEFRRLYPVAGQGKPPSLPSPAPYTDFVDWQRRFIESPSGNIQWEYWRRQLSGGIPPLDMPTDFPRPSRHSFAGENIIFKLDRTLTSRLKRLASDAQTTLFVVLLAGFETLLHHYTGRDEFLVTSLAAGRSQAAFERTVGFFINPVVIRAKLESQLTFATVIARARDTVAEAVEHQEFPFSLLVERLRPGRGTSLSPFSEVMFVLQSPHRFATEMKGLTEVVDMGLYSLGKTNAKADLGGLLVEKYNLQVSATQSDLDVELVESGDEISGVFSFRPDLYRPETITRMISRYQRLLGQAAESPQKPVSALKLLSESERKQVLDDWAGTKRQVLREECLHHLFEGQARRTPGAAAVLFRGESVSYGELEGRANRLARHLRDCGVGPETMVGICLERSVEMVVGMLGVLKAGGAYLPLEAGLPAERLRYMVEDAKPAVILMRGDGAGLFSGLASRVMDLDKQWAEISKRDGGEVESGVGGGNLAYVMYTSGTSGVPKGVMVEHRSLVNLMGSFQRSYGVGATDRVMQQTSVSFDASVEEIFPVLCAGGALCLPVEEDLRTIERRVEYIERMGVTIFGAVPSLLAQFKRHVERLRGVRLILSGGEAMVRSDIEGLAGGTLVSNEYGPTEATVYATYHVVGKGEIGERARVAIGRPIENTRVYVLDGNMEPVPAGVAGEIWIGGVGLARGYLNRPELTAERFVADPFRDGERIYKTGDLGRYLADGTLEFLGRTDQQVKIRGFRIELEEVEVALSRHQGVRQAAAVVREDIPGDKRLVAYLVCDQESPPRSQELRGFLESRLPGYMVPSAFVFLDKLPAASTDKIDRAALSASEEFRPVPETKYVGPRTASEDRLSKIWAGLFRLEKVGIRDNFFSLGGHSLKAVELNHLISLEFGLELSIRSIMESPTIEELAERIERALAEGITFVTPHGDFNQVIPLNSREKGPALFCVHPGGGHIYWYKQFAESLDMPVFGIQSRGLDRPANEIESLPAMAEEYAEFIRARQPSGPYRLLGWCNGGVYAWETAGVLEKNGCEVAEIVILDSWLAQNGGEEDSDFAPMIRMFMNLLGTQKEWHQVEKIARDLAVVLTGVPSEKRWGEAAQFVEGQVRAYPNSIQDAIRRQMNLLVRHDAWVREFRPCLLEADALVFWAGENRSSSLTKWAEYTRGKVYLESVPGNHYTMLSPPWVRILADRVLRIFDKKKAG